MRVFMTTNLHLAPATVWNDYLRISAGARQVFPGIVEFVLIEFKLSLGDFELIAQIFLGVVGCGGKLASQTRDQILVCLHHEFGLAPAGGQLPLLRRGSRRMFGGLAKGIGESEIDFVIGQPRSLMSEILFFGSRGQERQLAGRLQRRLVNCGRCLSGGFLAHGQNRLHALGQKQADRRGHNQHQQSNERDPLAGLHHRSVRPRRVISEQTKCISKPAFLRVTGEQRPGD